MALNSFSFSIIFSIKMMKKKENWQKNEESLKILQVYLQKDFSVWFIVIVMCMKMTIWLFPKLKCFPWYSEFTKQDFSVKIRKIKMVKTVSLHYLVNHTTYFFFNCREDSVKYSLESKAWWLKQYTGIPEFKYFHSCSGSKTWQLLNAMLCHFMDFSCNLSFFFSIFFVRIVFPFLCIFSMK